MEKMNNFYALFPKGFYRKEIYKKGSLSKENIMNDIDRLIPESMFDINEYDKISEKLERASKKFQDEFNLMLCKIERTKEDIEAVELCQKELRVYSEAMNEIIYPIYEKMLALGYTKEQLTG